MPVDDAKFKLYTVEELLAAPEPEWLIDCVISVGAFGIVYGPSGVGKTHVTLSWALSIATGTPWFGHSVKRSRVLYIAAEGGLSLQKRIAVWMREHSVQAVKGLLVLPADVQFVTETAKLLASTEEFAPEVIFADPFAECFAGLDENAQKDVSAFVRRVRDVQRPLGGTFGLVHHTGWEAKHERGSTVLRAAADVVVSIVGAGDTLTLECKKQRDFERFTPITLTLQPMDTVHRGRSFSSVVLRHSGQRVGTSLDLHPELSDALAVFASLPNDIVKSGDWKRALGIPERTFHDRRNGLLDKGCIELVKKGLYRMTSAGKSALGTATAE